MANNTTIKGINIAFGADTKEFDKDLKKVNRELKSVEKYGKTLSKSLSFDNATDGIKQLSKYLEVLETDLEGNQNKADALRKELQRLEDSGEIDNESYIKLNDELTKAETNAEQLSRKISVVKKDIKNLETDNIDELSKTTKKAYQGMEDLADATNDVGEASSGIDSGELADDLSNIAGEAANAAGGLGGFGDILSMGPALLNPYVAGITALGAGLTGIIKSSKNSKIALNQFQTSITSSDVSMNEASQTAKRMSRVLDVDVATAAGTAQEAMQDYGNEIRSQEDLFLKSTRFLALNESGIMDTSEAYAIASASSRNFGNTTKENEKLIDRLIQVQGNFGQQAEDIGDTYVEWGDTFAATGQDADDMLSILTTGLLLGARSTDEVANAWNELTLRIGDGTASDGVDMLNDALIETGKTTKQVDGAELNKSFADGGREAQGAVLELLSALSEVEDTTTRTAIAAEIFGTYGEEFIATAVSQKDAINDVSNEFDRQNTILETNQDILSNNKLWSQMAEDMNLTSGELRDLRDNFEEVGFKALDSQQKMFIFNGELDNMVDKQKLTNKESIQLSDTMGVLTGNLKLSEVSTGRLNKGLDLLGDKGFYSENAVNSLKDALKLLNGDVTLSEDAVNDLTFTIDQLGDSGEISSENVLTLKGNIKTLGDDAAEPQDKLNSLSGIVRDLGEDSLLTGDDVDTFQDKIAEMGDNTVDPKTRLEDLREVINGLAEPLGISEGAIDSFNSKLDDMEESASGTNSLDGVGNIMNETADDIDRAVGAVDRLTLSFIAMQGPAAIARARNFLGEDNFEALATSALGGADGVQSVIDNLTELGTLPDIEKELNIDIDKDGFIGEVESIEAVEIDGKTVGMTVDPTDKANMYGDFDAVEEVTFGDKVVEFKTNNTKFYEDLDEAEKAKINDKVTTFFGNNTPAFNSLNTLEQKGIKDKTFDILADSKTADEAIRRLKDENILDKDFSINAQDLASDTLASIQSQKDSIDGTANVNVTATDSTGGLLSNIFGSVFSGSPTISLTGSSAASPQGSRSLSNSTYNLSPNIYITNPTNTTSQGDARSIATQVSREIARRLK